MANTGQPNSGGSQFFINTVHNDFLDWFGPGPSSTPCSARVTSGMDIVNKIGVCKTDGNDCPVRRQDEQDHHQVMRAKNLSSKRDHNRRRALYY